jgi:hypothetical protein
MEETEKTWNTEDEEGGTSERAVVVGVQRASGKDNLSAQEREKKKRRR